MDRVENNNMLQLADLTEDEVIGIKNLVMTTLKNSKYFSRLDNNGTNLVDVTKYMMITCLLALELDTKDSFTLLDAIMNDCKTMIIKHHSQKGME